jgi:hypothetical protein
MFLFNECHFYLVKFIPCFGMIVNTFISRFHIPKRGSHRQGDDAQEAQHRADEHREKHNGHITQNQQRKPRRYFTSLVSGARQKREMELGKWL